MQKEDSIVYSIQLKTVIAVAKVIRTYLNAETLTHQSFSFCPLPFAI
jgi:hypothetical protein